ncbi:type II CAAX prenyl endopeptidase Rce1 family protein, partial [candidate division KSB1 bacterium]
MEFGFALALPMIFLPLIGDAVAGNLSLVKQAPNFLLDTIIFQIIFSGFGEEFLYRGFVQGELNSVFQKRFSIGNTKFGFALIFSAFLFAFLHLLNPFNPFTGQYGLSIGFFFLTLPVGFIAGLIRESSGGIYAAA